MPLSSGGVQVSGMIPDKIQELEKRVADLEEQVAELKVQRSLAVNRSRVAPPDPAPRYDEVWAEGQRWLDSMDGEPDITPWVDDGFVNAPGGEELELGPPYVEEWKQGKCIQCKADRSKTVGAIFHCDNCYHSLLAEVRRRNREAAYASLPESK